MTATLFFEEPLKRQAKGELKVTKIYPDLTPSPLALLRSVPLYSRATRVTVARARVLLGDCTPSLGSVELR